MRVSLEKLGETAFQRLEVVDPERTDSHPGEVVGYRCMECHKIDETREQIWHDEDCSHAGEGGRQYYDDLEPDVPGRPTPELSADHPITMIRAAQTDDTDGVHNGEVLAFRCECGNADEDVLEVVHDEACPLAGWHKYSHVATARSVAD